MDYKDLTEEREAAQEDSSLLTDEELEQVSGGYASNVCPYCGSEFEYVGSHIWRCTNPQCGYLDG